jgi:predicted HTH domain antitoxin
MTDATFVVHVPASLLQFGFDQNKIQHHITEWMVLSLFTDGQISSGKAARLLNINRADFLQLLHSRGIAYIDFTPDEFAEEVAAVDKLEEQLRK